MGAGRPRAAPRHRQRRRHRLGALDGVATLRDLFGLRDSQATQRDALLARARKVCANKAQLARLDDADGSRAGSSNHGWEDLAVFQAFSY